jgi:predicted RND superfamily exporter protein
MRRLVELALRLRFILLAVSAVLTGWLLYVTVTRAKLYDDPNTWLPADHPIGQLNNELQEKFGGGNLVTIEVSVEHGDIFNVETLAKVKRITRAIHLVNGVVPYNVISIADLKARYMKAIGDYMDSGPLMDQVPDTPEKMERLKYGVYSNPLNYGVLVSPDGKSTIIQADFRTGLGLAKDLPVTDPIAIYRDIERIIGPERDDNTRIYAAGTPIIIGWVNSDGLLYIGIAFVVFVAGVTAILWRAFKSFRGAFIAVTLGLVASVWGFGWRILMMGPVIESASALIAPFIIVAAAACHHTQFLKRFFDEEYPRTGDARTAIPDTFAPLLFPMMGSLVTDVVAFVVMASVPFTNISELGVVATIGLCAIVFNVFFLQIPMLALLHGDPEEARAVQQRKKEARKSWIMRKLESLVGHVVDRTRVGKAMVGSVLVAFAASLCVLPFIDVGQDNTYAIHNFLTRSWRSNQIYLMEMSIKQHFKAVYPLNILIETDGDEGLKEPEAVAKIDAYATDLEKVPGVSGVMGLPVYLKVMHQFFNAGYKSFFAVPKDRQEIGLYLDFYSQGDPGSFDSVVDVYYQKHLLRLYTSDTAHETVGTVMKAARELAVKHFADGTLRVKIGGGAVAIADGFNQTILKWLIYATVAGFVFSYAVLVPISRSFVGPALLMLPLVFGTTIWLAVMWLLGIEINSFSTAGMAMASGVGVDAELYLLGRFREEYAKHGRFNDALKEAFVAVREALTYSYLGLIAGCWFLIPIPLYVGYLGFGMGLILLLCFVCSFIISPYLWAVLKPKFLLPPASVEQMANRRAASS